MKPLISVIVPIYGVESYLQQCVDSIINQTYNNLEIILVDDESPDNCGEMCDEYALRDSRIRVIHKKNGGLSDARNAGLNVAQGEYIVFVDSDDWMELDGIEYMYHLAIENSADLVIGGVEKIDDETKQIITTTNNGTHELKVFDNKQEAIKEFFLNGCASWARLYKKDVHKGVLFPVDEINEDEAVVLNLIEQCNNIVKTNYVVYKYRYRSQSITSTRWHIKKLAWYEHCKANLEFVKKKYPELVNYAESRYYASIIWCLNNMTADVRQFSNKIKELRKVLRKEMSNLLRRALLNKREKMRAYLLAYCYYLYVIVVKMMKKQYT